MPLTEKRTGAFEQLRRRVSALQKAKLQGEAAQVLAATSVKLVADCLRESRSPYGEAYAPLTSRDGQPLMDHGYGGMAGSVAATQIGAGEFTIAITRGHPKTHNYGATIVPVMARALRFAIRGATVFAQKVVIPKRQMVPDERRGLGPIWARAYADELGALIRRALGVAT